MYLLDTNICIAILKDDTPVVRQFQIKYQDCYLSTLVLGELYKGVYGSTCVEKNLATLKTFESALPKVEFDVKASEEFGKIQGELKKIGKPTGQLDALIASVARSRQDILVTDNTRHFINISNLKLENWLRNSSQQNNT
jgi:tRNA(fMet)-specific endonuclease VapC